ncbi:VOC family protein [Prosthecomicrobium pneumaticum]|uniref:VOC domain-containing protein n=1 Tax=Prosthecomicrobium pneumaticum TaxID=81895 RepID=A0A7W9CVD2_9HYPH|nr:VOC family protein [Prosthecomicrobium pneumaticum]MBB5752588.1 hypothetical protein [Prosthecomicrobium pneumaticum]
MAETTPRNVVVWFEIASLDFDRAVAFYETIFATTLRREDMGAMRLAIFPYEGTGVSGAIVGSAQHAPGPGGTLVYLNCDGRLDAVVGRVEAAGGRLLSDKVTLPADMGAFFIVGDTEGNVVGLHAAA